MYRRGQVPDNTELLTRVLKVELGKLEGAITPNSDGGYEIPIAPTTPTTTATQGFIVYVDPSDRRLKVKGPSGTITVLGEP